SCTPLLHGSRGSCARRHESARFGRSAATVRCGIPPPVPIDGEVHQIKARPAQNAALAQCLANRLYAGSLLVVAVLTLVPATAGAQIYAWRDANGTLVLSDRELNTPTKIFEVQGAPSYRTTTADDRPAASPRYDDIVLAHAQRHALRPELVRAVIQVESGYNPMATSP